MTPIFVSNPDHPALEPFRSLKDSDVLRNHGCFVAEGKFVLQTLVSQSRFAARCVFLQPSRLEPLAPILSKLPKSVPIYVAERDVMAQIAGYDVHRGILALGEATPLTPCVIPQDGPVLVLSGINNPENTGALFRNAAAFGVGAILLDETCCHPLMRRAIRVSMGHTLHLPFTHGAPVGDLVITLEQAGYHICALSPENGLDIAGPYPDKPVAYVLGEEAHGLSTDFLDRFERRSIQMELGTDSLNVATSAAVALYALRQSKL